jgi:hypothetical protein
VVPLSGTSAGTACCAAARAGTGGVRPLTRTSARGIWGLSCLREGAGAHVSRPSPGRKDASRRAAGPLAHLPSASRDCGSSCIFRSRRGMGSGASVRSCRPSGAGALVARVAFVARSSSSQKLFGGWVLPAGPPSRGRERGEGAAQEVPAYRTVWWPRTVVRWLLVGGWPVGSLCATKTPSGATAAAPDVKQMCCSSGPPHPTSPRACPLSRAAQRAIHRSSFPPSVTSPPSVTPPLLVGEPQPQQRQRRKGARCPGRSCAGSPRRCASGWRRAAPRRQPARLPAAARCSKRCAAWQVGEARTRWCHQYPPPAGRWPWLTRRGPLSQRTGHRSD